MEPNFSGWVTKADLPCTDGRTIKPGAFAHQDGATVPLVFQHNHNDINQVLGKVTLVDKPEGVWGDVYLNETQSAENAKLAVQHGDIDRFSIWAKDLLERGADVLRGQIQEVSLVLAGSNPGATIQNVLAHSGFDEGDYLIVVGNEIVHTGISKSDDTGDKDNPEQDKKSIADVLDTLNDDQRTAVNAFFDEIVDEAIADKLAERENIQHDDLQDKENNDMNLFENGKKPATASEGKQLKHDDFQKVMTAATAGSGRSLKDTARELLHAADYGVQNIDILFPDAQDIMKMPTFVDRRQEWVRTFINGTHKTPFSHIKTMHADITADEARARGHIKGNEKVEEVFPIFKRTTGPAMIYKKQKLDRQDILQITTFDVVAWIKAEMRGKLDEEIARAALFGDGRPVMIGNSMNADKIKEPQASATSGDGIRSIVNDHQLYTSTFEVEMSAHMNTADKLRLIDSVTENREHYRGSNNITGFISFRLASQMLTMRDAFGHRVYKNLADLANELEVTTLVRVPTELFPPRTMLVLLDLVDYNFGTNAGGEVTLFDDFDIDFNQYKYLMETFLSGALTLPYSAQVYKSTEMDGLDEVTPTAPSFSANKVTIPDVDGVAYRNSSTLQEYDAEDQITLTVGQNVQIVATPKSGYVFADGNPFKTWNFAYTA